MAPTSGVADAVLRALKVLMGLSPDAARFDKRYTIKRLAT